MQGRSSVLCRTICYRTPMYEVRPDGTREVDEGTSQMAGAEVEVRPGGPVR